MDLQWYLTGCHILLILRSIVRCFNSVRVIMCVFAGRV